MFYDSSDRDKKAVGVWLSFRKLEMLDKVNAELLFSKFLSIRNTGSLVRPIGGWFKTEETILFFTLKTGNYWIYLLQKSVEAVSTD